MLRAEQVGPPDSADQQRAAGQQQERLVGPGGVRDGIADVLRGVPRRVERPEADRADLEGLAVAQPAGARGELGAGADDVGRAGQRRELATARDVVVVEVRLDDVGDAQIRVARGVEIDVDVATRVDDAAAPPRLVGEERREVPSPSIRYCVTRMAQPTPRCEAPADREGLGHSLHHHQAAVDGEHLAGDERGLVLSQERDRMRRSPRSSPKRPSGVRADDLVLQRVGQVLGQLGEDEARARRR